MKTRFVFLFLLTLGFSAAAQKHDYQWLFGYGNAYVGVDSFRGGVNIDFNYSPALTYQHVRPAGFAATNTSYCDKNGQLLMYSNGADVYDSRDSIMPNGDSINSKWIWNYSFHDSLERYEGLHMPQSIITLPDPLDTLNAFIFHHSLMFTFSLPNIPPSYLPDTTYYTKVDFRQNFGYGDVVQKNVIISADTFNFGMTSAVLHGNGRDWWIIKPAYRGNNYYLFTLNDAGLTLDHVQAEGPVHVGVGDIGTSCFSPDGQKYFWVTAADGIYMFDFDRCTGLLSNGQIIPWPYPSFKDSLSLAAGIAVSPNNRFLYVATSKIVLQYNLLATNIGASVDTVAVWDGSYDPYSPLAATFYISQLGPDGKIYINAPNSTISLHVINRPNEVGDSCLFVQRGVKLNTYNAESMPNFPNYRLGALTGSPCDTLSTLTEDLRAEKEKQLRVFPNPAKDVVTIDYGFTDWNKGDVSLEVSNTLGQLVYTQGIPRYSGFQKVEVTGFASGAYQVSVIRKGQVVSTAKFVKE